jgi:cellulose biosynthesis protein BcsQ
MTIFHIDELRDKLKKGLLNILKKNRKSKIEIIHDIYGKFNLIIWVENDDEIKLVESIKLELSDCSVSLNSESFIVVNSHTSKIDKQIYESAWIEGETHPEESRLKILERYRTHGGWIGPLMEAPWGSSNLLDPTKPPIIVFYSFKGGVGRTTALAAFAIKRARLGERVAIIDADLDAPGIGTLISTDGEEIVNSSEAPYWGVIDYMLEKKLQKQKIDLREYYHVCRRDKITGTGEIYVFPAGKINLDYPWKLARVDLEPSIGTKEKHIFYALVNDVRRTIKPDWILIDVRAGLAVPAGLLVSGFAHLNVLFGTSSEQSWNGLKLVLDRLGAQRIHANRPQDDLILVHAMVPRDVKLREIAEKEFTEHASELFSDLYYAEAGLDNDEFWSIDDIESTEAPHIPIVIQYDEGLTTFKNIDQIIDKILDSTDYKRLTEKIASRFGDNRNE